MGKKMAEELIAELRELMPKTDMKSLKRANEIAEWFKNHPEDKEANEVFLGYMNTHGVDDIELGVRNMRKQVIAEQLESRIIHTNNHKIVDYDAVLDAEFGKEGTPEREAAEKAAYEFYFGQR